MSETLIGTYSKRLYAEREAASLMADMPEGVTIVLRVNDDATWSLFESTTDDDAALQEWLTRHPAHTTCLTR